MSETTQATPAAGQGTDVSGGSPRSVRVAVREAVFKEFGEDGPEARPDQAPAPMEILLDIPLQLTVELGRTRRMIKDVLALGPGAVVELDRLAGEPVDVLVNGKLLGKGEVVVINENFGVRITDILSPTERIEQLD